MTARPKTLSARAQACELWDDGDTRSDAELAAALGVVVQTIRAYHQQRNRANGKRNNRKLPPEVEVAILEMRNVGGMSFPAIAEVVQEDFGYGITAKLAAEYCHRNADGLPVPVEVDEADLPLMTSVGVCWAVKIWPPARSTSKRDRHKDFCDFCPHKSQCLEAELAHQFVRCEKLLELEMMEVTG